ncbi:sulfite exporter TauE/SafE family protein [Butyrivibrio sp.]|uniref:sulfite exporter TauE/SafE family protein n=1 Tax=Butyrivibrio sp. TaxID=28121 RepID=UPI0025BF7592|nr:sulfite exporter TauE/SafE family protein [Butyrivibrio sp.]MBQ9305712.1 sulfite exporter TauE/SafE family protein [Butyrivibrio sp.]
MNEFLFYLVILLSNIIQGITGFAGTILAMPASLRLVGMRTAVPVLNLLGLLSGIYVFIGNREYINKKVLKKVVLVMGVTVIAGLFIKKLLLSNTRLLYWILGFIVVTIALSGLVKIFRKAPEESLSEPVLNLLLLAAGVVHGMYVCGGPLLIAYMTKKIPEKSSFRATISTTWIFLNGIIFLSHIYSGSFTPDVVRSSFISVPFLLGGMFAGSVLYKKMSQSFFVKLTYVLLLISGISLFFK